MTITFQQIWVWSLDYEPPRIDYNTKLTSWQVYRQVPSFDEENLDQLVEGIHSEANNICRALTITMPFSLTTPLDFKLSLPSCDDLHLIYGKQSGLKKPRASGERRVLQTQSTMLPTTGRSILKRTWQLSNLLTLLILTHIILPNEPT